MAGISAIGGIPNAVFEAEYAARVAKLGKDAVNEQGKRALELIAAATVDPQSGQNLNITV